MTKRQRKVVVLFVLWAVGSFVSVKYASGETIAYEYAAVWIIGIFFPFRSFIKSLGIIAEFRKRKKNGPRLFILQTYARRDFVRVLQAISSIWAAVASLYAPLAPTVLPALFGAAFCFVGNVIFDSDDRDAIEQGNA